MEAILVIGSLVIILGIILLIPGLWWARRKARKDPAFAKKANFTPIGWLFLCVMLSFLLGGLCMQYLYPESSIGKLTATSLGRILWTAIIIFIFYIIQKLLNSYGVVIEKDDEKSKDV